MHHPIVAADAVTGVLIRLWSLVLRVFLVLGEDHVLDMGVEWNLRVEDLRAFSDPDPQPLGFKVAAIHLLDFLPVNRIEDCIRVVSCIRILGTQICCGDPNSELIVRLLHDLGSGVVIGLVVGVVPEPQFFVLLIRLLDSRLTEAMSVKGAMSLNINELHTIVLISVDRALDSRIECSTPFIEVHSNICRHFRVIFTIGVWIRRAGKGDTIASWVDFVEELPIARDVQFEHVTNGVLSAFSDSLFNQVINIVDKVWAV